MTNTHSIYIHSQTALPKEYSNLLKEGSSVLVRILKDSGNGKFIASFAGGRYPIVSKEKLAPGSTFMARVSIADGKLNLTKIANTTTNQNIENKPVVQSSNVMSPQVAELLMSLGLPSDSVSKMLLQTLVSYGAKINLEKINRARNAALNFPGQEDEAAEAAMILIEKGIEPSIENIRDVMTGFGMSSEATQNSYENEINKTDNPEIEKLAGEFKEYFENLLTGKNTPEAPGGFLTVFNHMVSFDKESKEGQNRTYEKMHWIVVPFEFGFEKAEKIIKGSGVIRVFLDLNEKSARNSVINFTINGELWTFVVSFKGKDIQKVLFSHYPEMDDATKTLLKSRLQVYFENVPVDVENTEVLAGFASGNVLLPVAKGYA